LEQRQCGKEKKVFGVIPPEDDENIWRELLFDADWRN
jgi:hypothetical protein